MEWTTLILMAAITLAAALYAHLELGRLTPTPAQASIARAVLVAVGLGFGWIAMQRTAPDASPTMGFLVFAAAFGLVHTPAAIVLMLKRLQRRDPPAH